MRMHVERGCDGKGTNCQGGVVACIDNYQYLCILQFSGISMIIVLGPCDC